MRRRLELEVKQADLETQKEANEKAEGTSLPQPCFSESPDQYRYR
ncbi:hypothetical protein [Ruminococcus albus]|nr:hypothetical protein [Ruminococcus albus]